MMRIATLCSHGGSILQAVIDAIEGGTLDAQIVLVISNNSRAEAIRRATRHGIPTLHLSSHTHPDEAARDAALTSALAESAADWVLLAGYMKKLGPQTLARFPQRILNTHPALLPKHGGRGFYGRRVHEAVLAAGETESGATMHLINDDYDTGPIVDQTRVPVKPDDDPETLEERVKIAERALVVATLARLVEQAEADYA